MVFSSLIFIFIFLPITLIIYYLVPRTKQNYVLLISSLFFYGWGEPVYIILMVISIMINHLGGLLIQEYRENKDFCKFIFITVLVVDLSSLVFFKYYGFIVDNINLIFNTSLRIRNLPLPLGISFYTFQLISYVADVYMERVEAQDNIITFGAYISMFPQLVAGPIVQYRHVKEQLFNREESIYKFGVGVERFIMGVGKKVLLANNLGLVWKAIKAMPIGEISLLSSWLGIIAFTLQIYFDFSGYSDMAIGLGKMMGFDFLENFKYPYISRSVTEFWRRWHMSLSGWFREYMYIPLGGNRRGNKIQFRNLMIVWFATGLWHGASWNFVVWGLYFGVLIFLEKMYISKFLEKLPKGFGHVYTLILIIIGWVFFEATSLRGAMAYLSVMFGMSGNAIIDNMGIYTLRSNFLIITLAIIAATPFFKNLFKLIKEKLQLRGVAVAIVSNIIILFVSTVYLVSETYNPFLYFRF